MKSHSLKKYLKLLITIAILSTIFIKFDINLGDIINRVKVKYLIIACLVRIFISPLISINRWKTFLFHAGIEETFFSLLKISMLSAFFGIALPSSQGADAIRMYLIEKKHKGKSLNFTTSSTVLMERIIGLVLLAFLGLIFGLITVFPNKMHVIIIILSINVAIWLGIFTLTNQTLFNYFQNKINQSKKFARLNHFLIKTYYTFVNYPYRKVLASSILLILSLQIITVIIVYLVFLAFGVDIPFSQHLVFYPIISILSIIPISISGLGVREGFFVYFYSLIGVSADIAVSVSLINYCIEILLMAIMGGIIYIFDSIIIKKK